ncbi:helix-turn-helix domain-containing protein [Marinilactibacillus kalidii]|uniref:helix-turn-helix domain-containing protein n=1 Tax=Marinilactibacillus kalidii TaxID=2820274 RepID=UPI001ABEC54C|nr:helix-turn-helix transcriptional regulator [Marinilactibacillus kalidii]
MSIEDQDYLTRQIQMITKSIGKFLDLFSIKEIIESNYNLAGEMSDSKIETIVYMTRIEDIQFSKNLSLEELSQEIGINQNRLSVLINNEDSADEQELAKLLAYLEKHE